MPKTAILIPARLGSERLPQKLILPLGESTVIGQCLKRIQSAQTGCPIILCTDSTRLAAEAETLGIDIAMTPDHFSCGSDRIAHVAKMRSEDFILNVQADEAFISPQVIQHMITARESSTADIVSCMVPIENPDIFQQSSVVKVVCTQNRRAMYFSRAPIPFPRRATVDHPILGYGHIGLYAYTRAALLRFSSLPPSPLEHREGLEQLRALEAGMSIEMIEVSEASLSIDTQADYDWAIKLVEKK